MNTNRKQGRSRRSFGAISLMRSGRFQASYWEGGRKHYAHTTFTTKALANRWLADVQASIEAGTWSPPPLRPRQHRKVVQLRPAVAKPVPAETTEPTVPGMLTLGQAASFLAVSERTVRRFIEGGELPGYRLGSHMTRVRLADLEALLIPINPRSEPKGN